MMVGVAGSGHLRGVGAMDEHLRRVYRTVEAPNEGIRIKDIVMEF